MSTSAPRSRAALAATTLLALALGGCLSMPLTTLWRMSRFDAEDFVALQPPDVRAAVQIEDSVTVDPASAHIGVRIARSDGEVLVSRATLALLQHDRRAPAGLRPAGDGRRWMVYALTPDGQRELRRFQAQVAGLRNADFGEVQINIDPGQLGGLPAEADRFHVEIWMQLDAVEGWFQMLKETAVPGRPEQPRRL